MTRKERFQKIRDEKRGNVFRRIVKFILAFFISFIIFSVLLTAIILYNPFDTRLKELFVTTAMTTMEHQYLARWFFSDEEIKSIMEKNKISDPGRNSDAGEINPGARGSGDIQLVNISGAGYKGCLLIIKDPARVSVAATELLGEKGMLVEDIVKKNNAEAGINAGGFMDANGHGSGGTPLGMLIEGSRLINVDSVYKHNIIGFDKNNVLVLGNYTLKEIKDMGIRDAVSFKPFLILNGEPVIKKGNGGWGLAPRTAIGQRKDGAVLLLTIDGRQVGSIGATLKDVQDIMLQYGAHNAANLDGGASTTMVYRDGIVNNPSSKAGPRYVPSAFIVK